VASKLHAIDALVIVQTVAALGALYYAWRTVAAARDTERIAARERRARLLGEIIEATSKLYFEVGWGAEVQCAPRQAVLAALLAGADFEIPATRGLTEIPVTKLEDRVAAQSVAERSLRELEGLAREGVGVPNG
jgi:hypothetical protein